MAIDALVLAGDRKGARLLYGTNKAFLNLRGRPLLSYVLSVLDQCAEVRSIYIVGPGERLRELLSGFKYQKRISYIEQAENIFQNLWYGALHTFPEYVRGSDYRNLSHLPEAEKIILATTCDLPLLVPMEVDRFIRDAPVSEYDLVFGITRKQMLLPFAPQDNLPGIEFAYFVFRDIIFRHANIFLLRPLKLGYVMEQFIPMIYGMRYQKQWKNIIKAFWTILRLGVGAKGIWYFFILQMGKSADLKNWRAWRDLVRKGASLKGVLDYIQPILQTRFTAFETIGPGPAIDVDSEQDLAIFEQNYERWQELQSLILEGRYPLPTKF